MTPAFIVANEAVDESEQPLQRVVPQGVKRAV